MLETAPAEIQPAALGLSLTGKPLPRFDEPVRAPLGHTPVRRPGSVRRTMSIDVRWPDGIEGSGLYLGRARDILTPREGGAAVVLAQAEANLIAAHRRIEAVEATPAPRRLQELVGARAGGYLRAALAESVPEEKAAGTPLYLILDDMAGATLVSQWAQSRWDDEWLTRANQASPSMEGVCIGFRPGSSALKEGGHPDAKQNACRIVPLPNPADPAGWHELPTSEGMHFRRARYIDLWREDGELVVETRFQDSASASDGGPRWAIHEYLVEARIGAGGRIGSLIATPGTLPYSSCRVAPVNTEVLIGTRVRDLREVVLERLKFTGGCTHLNDTLRSLAETEVLAAQLPPE